MSGPAVLRVAGRRRADRIAAVDVVGLSLPAAEGLVGCTVAEARRRVADVLPSSTRAHGLALAAACAVARGEAPAGGETVVLVERSLAAESAQEHVCRLLLDWPPLFGHATPRHHFSHLHHRLGHLRGAREAFVGGGELLDLVANELLSGFFRAMREPGSLGQFVAMARRSGTLGTTLADLIELGAYVPPEEICAPLLPALSAADLAAELGGLPGQAFCQGPTWQGQSCETGALARQIGSPLVAMLVAQGHRIAARLFARVVDLGECASRLRHPLPADLPPLLDAAPLAPDCGLARVRTARGLLVHAVRLEGERVAQYAVVAPEAWNFHPDGPLPREARGRPAADPALALLRLRALVLALDPGSDFEVALEDDAESAGNA